jgi:hypothetical protein
MMELRNRKLEQQLHNRKLVLHRKLALRSKLELRSKTTTGSSS